MTFPVRDRGQRFAIEYRNLHSHKWQRMGWTNAPATFVESATACPYMGAIRITDRNIGLVETIVTDEGTVDLEDYSEVMP